MSYSLKLIIFIFLLFFLIFYLIFFLILLFFSILFYENMILKILDNTNLVIIVWNDALI